MMVTRRTLLASALGGGALAALRAVPAMAAAMPRPVQTLILADPGIDRSFARAVAARTAGQVHVVAGPRTLADAARWLAAAPDRQVVGLVSAADGVLFQQMAPRGRLSWRAETHHPVRHAPARSGWQAALGESLGRVASGRDPGGRPVAFAADRPLMSFVVAG